MTGGDDGGGFDIDTAFALQNTQHRERMRHQRGLRVFREDQFLARTFEHQAREFLFQSFIDFLEHLARDEKALGEIASHADSLTTLAGEDERVNRHAWAPES